MALKRVGFLVGCAVVGALVLVLLMLGGGILFIYAVFEEISDRLRGRVWDGPDPAAARKIAEDICAGGDGELAAPPAAVRSVRMSAPRQTVPTASELIDPVAGASRAHLD